MDRYSIKTSTQNVLTLYGDSSLMFAVFKATTRYEYGSLIMHIYVYNDTISKNLYLNQNTTIDYSFSNVNICNEIVYHAGIATTKSNTNRPDMRIKLKNCILSNNGNYSSDRVDIDKDCIYR